MKYNIFLIGIFHIISYSCHLKIMYILSYPYVYLKCCFWPLFLIENSLFHNGCLIYHSFLQDDLLAELDELEQETLDEQMLNIGSAAELPNVPRTELPKQERGSLIPV